MSRCSCCSTRTFQSHGSLELTSRMLFRSRWSPGSVILRSERWTFLCLLRCWSAHYPELRSGAWSRHELQNVPCVSCLLRYLRLLAFVSSHPDRQQ